ncbi:hypothetical protein [Thauera phenolivorans]|uniref:hypothetical protein n=1 Tax=Thauera phenolivorans TaxID=1792543 RepID=UPI00083BA20B|nr:hypothetical protein [Thauera phenolivorans]
MMTKIDAAALADLLAVVRAEMPDTQRIAALEAALCLPLDEAGWRACADLAWQLLAGLAPHSPSRHRLLALAARIPLRSLRERLRTFAAVAPATERAVIEAALAEAARTGPAAIDDLPQAAARSAPRGQVERAAAAPAEARRVNACLLHQGERRNTFVAGAHCVLRCWIGLPVPDLAAHADLAVPTVDIPDEGLELTAVMTSGGSAMRRKLVLPADRSLPSNACDFPLEVPAHERHLAVELVFLFRGRVFEAVSIDAAVLAAGEPELPGQALLRVRVLASRRQALEIADSAPVDSLLVCGAAGLQRIGELEVRRYDLSQANRAIDWLNEKAFLTQATLVRREEANGESGAGLDPEDPAVLALLRTMARHGATLHGVLAVQGFTDPGERIQVLNLDPQTYAPFEFVYDRGYPADDARLCPEGLAALATEAAHCPRCRGPVPDDQRAAMPLVCPFGFWSIAKIIERLDPDELADPSLPNARRRSLPALDAVVFASSELVPEDERELTWRALQRSFARATLARDWSEWRQAVRAHPPLLLALPHHGEADALDYLQIGEDTLPPRLGRLSRGQIGAEYLNPGGLEPGPIVLLLGCRTATESGAGYVQLTRYLQQHKTAIVLGTLAEVLGRHAAPLARELVAELVAVNDPRADFGTILRRVRRRMLARGHLIALCLVALGDAQWRLTPRPAEASARPAA